MANGDHDWVAAEVVTAANVDDYLQLQTVQKYATSAARDTALSARKREGMHTYQDDANCDTVYSGTTWSTVGPVHGAWLSFPATWSGTLGNGSVVGSYMRVGRSIQYRVKVTWGSTTSHAAANQTVTFPIAMHTDYTVGTNCGTVSSYDSSAVLIATNAIVVCSTGANIVTMQGTGSSTLWTNTNPIIWATGDVFFLTGFYEAAADA